MAEYLSRIPHRISSRQRRIKRKAGLRILTHAVFRGRSRQDPLGDRRSLGRVKLRFRNNH